MNNNDYEIIDIHVHLFKTLRHEKVGSAHPGRRDCDRWGTPEAIIPFMDRNGISKTVFVNVFPTNELIESALKELSSELAPQERVKAEQNIKIDIVDKIKRHNDWGCQIGKQYPRLIPFIGIQKILGAKGIADEVALRVSQGAKGVKIHPGICLFYPDDKELWPLYEICQGLDVPILSDSGPYIGAPSSGEYGEPVHFTEVLKNFPRLTLILAHLGSAFWDERIEIAQKFHNVYFDCSQGFSTPEAMSYHGYRGLSAADAVRVIRKVGVERIIFGSDGPIFDLEPQIEEILRLDLKDEERKMILGANARRILKF